MALPEAIKPTWQLIEYIWAVCPIDTYLHSLFCYSSDYVHLLIIVFSFPIIIAIVFDVSLYTVDYYIFCLPVSTTCLR